MDQITNPIQACKQMVLKPNSVFAEIKERPNWSWIPFIFVLAASILPGLFYFSIVDFNWYIDTLTSSQYGNVSPAEQETFKQSMSLEQMRFLTLLGGTVGVAQLFPHRTHGEGGAGANADPPRGSPGTPRGIRPGEPDDPGFGGGRPGRDGDSHRRGG